MTLDEILGEPAHVARAARLHQRLLEPCSTSEEVLFRIAAACECLAIGALEQALTHLTALDDLTQTAGLWMRSSQRYADEAAHICSLQLAIRLLDIHDDVSYRVYSFSGMHQRAIFHAQMVIDRAVKRSDKTRLGDAFFYLGQSQMRLTSYKEAESSFANAVTNYEAVGKLSLALKSLVCRVQAATFFCNDERIRTLAVAVENRAREWSLSPQDVPDLLSLQRFLLLKVMSIDLNTDEYLEIARMNSKDYEGFRSLLQGIAARLSVHEPQRWNVIRDLTSHALNVEVALDANRISLTAYWARAECELGRTSEVVQQLTPFVEDLLAGIAAASDLGEVHALCEMSSQFVLYFVAALLDERAFEHALVTLESTHKATLPRLLGRYLDEYIEISLREHSERSRRAFCRFYLPVKSESQVWVLVLVGSELRVLQHTQITSREVEEATTAWNDARSRFSTLPLAKHHMAFAIETEKIVDLLTTLVTAPLVDVRKGEPVESLRGLISGVKRDGFELVICEGSLIGGLPIQCVMSCSGVTPNVMTHGLLSMMGIELVGQARFVLVADDSLPGSVCELDQLRRLVPEIEHVTAHQADAKMLQNILRNARYVHMSVHARAGLRPALSSLSLGESDKDGVTGEGIAGFRLSCDLVFLAACETMRLGSWDHLGSSLSLVDAFIVAGVKCVVGTQWSIDDSASSVFAVLFWESLLTTPDASAVRALASAQDIFQGTRAWPSWALCVVDEEQRNEWRKPFYWGAFRVVGRV